MFSSPSPIAARHTRATGGQSTSDQIQVPVDSGGSGALRNTVVTAEVSEDEDAIMEAAYRIAIEVRVRQIPPSYRLLNLQFSPGSAFPKAVNATLPPTLLATLCLQSSGPATKVLSIMFNPHRA